MSPKSGDTGDSGDISMTKYEINLPKPLIYQALHVSPFSGDRY